MSDGLKTYRSYQLDKSIIKLSWSTTLLASVFTACIFVLIPFLKTKPTQPETVKVTNIENITLDRKEQPKKLNEEQPQDTKSVKKPNNPAPTQSLPTPPQVPSVKTPAPKLKLSFDLKAEPIAFELKHDFKTQAPPKAIQTPTVIDSSTNTPPTSATGNDKGIAIDYSGVFSEKDLDQNIRPSSRTAPIYPRMAKRRNIQATVNCSFIINTEGKVEQIKIIDTVPAGHEKLFEAACRRALLKWKFTPSTKDGRRVRVQVFQELEFKLK